MKVGPDSSVGANQDRLFPPVRVRRKKCLVRVAGHARIEHMGIDQTQLELLPVGLRSSTDRTIDLVIQS